MSVYDNSFDKTLLFLILSESGSFMHMINEVKLVELFTKHPSDICFLDHLIDFL